MSKLHLFLMACSLSLLYSSVVFAQWVQTNRPFGGMAGCFTTSGSNLFVGTMGGVYLSIDNGTSWTEVNSGLTEKNVSTLAAIGTNLFAGTYGGGVFLSTNNGASWKAINTGLTNPYIGQLAVKDSNLFARTDGSGVFLSTNNGTSWSPVNNGLTNLYVYRLTVSGSNLFA